jgi:CubicO group peptidase (beta-lactamase class C family)
MYDLPIQFANTDADFEMLSTVVVAAMRRLSVPGVAVGVLANGRQYMAGFGITSVENPLPVTADTLFQIGSTTKTVTGMMIMRLVEQTLIDLDEPVRTYIPDFRLKDWDAEATVTVRHLLTHMSGWAGDYFSDTGNGDDCLARFVVEMAELPQLVPPGSIWAYNNAGFSLAGRIIEVVTGKTYEEAAQALVLEPMAMTNSFFYPADVISRRFAAGHRVDDKNGPVVSRPWALARAAHSAGGLCSSIRDQLRYARFHLGDGTAPGGEQLLSRETMHAMQSPHFPANLGRQMGLSWILKELDGQKIVLHGGATNGQLSAFLMVPGRDFAITVLTNAEEGGMLHDEVTNWALDHYLGLKEPEVTHLTLGQEELSQYLGMYEAQMMRLRLYVEGQQLMVQATPLGGFPDKDSPAPPAPPPSRLAFYETDRAIALDPPLVNSKIEFLRDENSQLAWLRTSRLFRRLQPY